MSINERIQCVVDELFSGNKARFAKAINRTPNTISNILGARKSLPSSDILEAIANSIESIDLRWLLTGSGDMLARSLNHSSSSLQSSQGAEAQVPVLNEPTVEYAITDLAIMKNVIIEKDKQIRTLLNDKEQLVNDKNDLRSDKQRLLDEIDDLKAQLGRQGSRVGNAG